MKFYKFLSVGLIVGTLMANASITFAETTPFKDVTMDNPNFEAISFLKGKGVIDGYPDGTFRPNQVVKRAEALKMIYSSEAENAWGTADDAIFGGAAVEVNFKDVDKEGWYFEFVQQGMNDDVISGYSDGTFRPEQPVNVAENIKMLLEHSLLRVDGAGLENTYTIEPFFTDVPEDAWYKRYVMYAREKDVVKVEGDKKLNPTKEMTRGDLSQMIYNMYKADEKWPVYNAIRNATTGKFDIVNDLGDVVAGTLPDYVSETDETDGRIAKVTDKYAYAEICSSGFGGYILYNFCYGNTYQVNLTTGSVKQLDPANPVGSENELFLQDVSPDELYTAWKVDQPNQIFIYDMDGKQVHNYKVDDKYTQFGDVKFSPDGKKLAYAATIASDLEHDESVIYVVDIAAGTQTEYKKVSGAYVSLNVVGWDNNETVKYKSYINM